MKVQQRYSKLMKWNDTMKEIKKKKKDLIGKNKICFSSGQG